MNEAGDFRCYDLVMAQVLLTDGHRINWVKVNKQTGKLVFYFENDSTLWNDARALIQKRKNGEKLLPYKKEIKYHDDEMGWTVFTDGSKLLDEDNPFIKE